MINILQIDESHFREKFAIDSYRQGIGEVSDNILAPSIQADPGTFRCHRGRLEKLLREDQDIRWEHTVQNVTASSQGIVVQLKDEEPFHAKVLIGTDGVHSQVRKSLAPQIELKVLPFVVFNGKRQFTTAEFQDRFAPNMHDRTIIHSRHDEIILEIAISDYTHKHVDVSYTYSRPARQNDPLHKPDRAIPGATDIPEDFYTELQTLKDLEPPFSIIFDESKIRRDRVLHWLMRTTLGRPAEVMDLAKQGVLLVGDAIHAMPILGGEGANNALKDGVDLAQHIARYGTGSLHEFTAARYDEWEKGVAESEKRLADMHSQAKASL